MLTINAENAIAMKPENMARLTEVYKANMPVVTVEVQPDGSGTVIEPVPSVEEVSLTAAPEEIPAVPEATDLPLEPAVAEAPVEAPVAESIEPAPDMVAAVEPQIIEAPVIEAPDQSAAELVAEPQPDIPMEPVPDAPAPLPEEPVQTNADMLASEFGIEPASADVASPFETPVEAPILEEPVNINPAPLPEAPVAESNVENEIAVLEAAKRIENDLAIIVNLVQSKQQNNEPITTNVFDEPQGLSMAA